MWLLLHRTGRSYLVEDRPVYNTEYGMVEIKKGLVKSSTGEDFLITDPWFVDMWKRIRRGPQITHWKDLGLIVTLTGLGPGWKVLEVGSGSGFSTIFFSHIVGERGKVVTYERNPRHYRIMEENIERMGVNNVEHYLGDPLKEGINGKDFDMVFLDLPEPWTMIDVVSDALKPAGFLVSYLPTIEQVKKLEESLTDRFTEPQLHEVIHREWKLGGRTRPISSGILHTAFVVLSRKIR